MLRASIALNAALLVAVAALSWSVSRRDAAADASAGFAETADAARGIDDPPATGAWQPSQVDVEMLDRLQRIDARIAALEAGGRGMPPASTAPARVDPAVAADADRRIALMFSDREVDEQDWARWQAALARMPAHEQIALGAAVARAGNRDHLILRF